MVVSAAADLTSSVRVISGSPPCRPAFPRSRRTVRGQVMWRDEGPLIGGRRCLGVAHTRVNWATTGAWSDSGNFTSVRKAPDSSGRYSLWISVCSRVASSAREART
jgi:hypothetical protein